MITDVLRPHAGQIFRRGLRFTSTTTVLDDKALAKLFVLPLTHDKSFVYFKYNEDKLLNSNSLIVKYENRAVTFATKAWNKLRDSEKSYNKKIVYYVTKFLEQTPWTEDSLRSIPSKSALLRQVHRMEQIEGESVVSIKAIEEIKPGDEKLINIPVYYPATLLTTSELESEITTLATKGEAYHSRHMILTGIGIPITLPFALVPVIPNIPGFYLAYRFYCNFKAFLASKHLTEMLKGDELVMKDDELLDNIYEISKKELGENDGLLMNEGIIDKIVETYQIPEARAILLKALRQERKKFKLDSEKM